MTTQDDIRRIASKLPGAEEGPQWFGFSVMNKGKAKGFLWSWSEKVHPKRPKVKNDSVLAVIVPNLEAKEILLASDPDKFFTEPHYNGFPAILVRLEAIGAEELEDLIIEAWRCKAPAAVVKAYDAICDT